MDVSLETRMLRRLAPFAFSLIAGASVAASEISPVPSGELLAPGVLTACLDVKGGIMSSRRTKGGAGFDYEVLAAVADRLGLELDVTWFEGD